MNSSIASFLTGAAKTATKSAMLAAMMAASAATSSAWAQESTEKAAEEPKQRKCDYDINADCRGRDRPQRIQNKEGAPVDLTGYWVSVVTEDWRWRMKTPPKGDVASLPLQLLEAGAVRF